VSSCDKKIIPPALSADELARYSRQIRLPQIAAAGQQKLRKARVLLLGLGGLGSPAALYLAAAGIGTLGVAEFDTVALHNLQRQILFRETDVGTPKIEAGFAALRGLNAQTRLIAHTGGLTPQNALELFAQYDLVLDGTDNFATRYLANDAAVLTRRPLVHGSVFQFTGQVAVFAAGSPAGNAAGGEREEQNDAAPCYRCMFPEMPDPATVPTCEQAGVFGALCGVIGCWMAMEAIKLITGAGELLLGRVLTLDLLAGTVQTVRLQRNSECPVCGAQPRITKITPSNYVFNSCTTPKLETLNLETTASAELPAEEISCEEAAALLKTNTAETPLLLDVRDADERAICLITGALHIPLAELSERLSERLDELRAAAGNAAGDRLILVHCHHGMRSLRAVRILRAKGFLNARSITGGIDRWAQVIEPTLRRY
jgi:adenylyltransferase/sulfurtransferase